MSGKQFGLTEIFHIGFCKVGLTDLDIVIVS